MGVLGRLMSLVFGSDRNVVRETVEVFRENAEASAIRSHDQRAAALHQFSTEFRATNRGAFDRLVDGLNRLPRPLMAFGCLGLFVSAMATPEWFVSRMQGIALIPEPLWWLMGVVVSFYFGARHQFKGQEFQRSIAEDLVRAQRTISELGYSPSGQSVRDSNPALEDWRNRRNG